jgi:hypothetical protein
MRTIKRRNIRRRNRRVVRRIRSGRRTARV